MKVNKSCENCKHRIKKVDDGEMASYKTCEILEKELKAVNIESLMAQKFFCSQFCCKAYESKFMTYPLEVGKIEENYEWEERYNDMIGKPVKVELMRAPGQEEIEIYGGIYVGMLPVSINFDYTKDNKTLTASFRETEGLYVPKLKKIIYGLECYWNFIREEDLAKDCNFEENMGNLFENLIA